MTVDFDSIEDELNSSSGGNDDSEYEREDQPWDDAPIMHARPRSIIDAEEIVHVAINKRWDDTQNLRGVPGKEPDGQAIIVLREPHVVHGELWESTDEEQATDFKVVGADDENIDPKYGPDGQVGIEGESFSFQSEEVDDIGSEYVKLFRGGMAGERLLRTLDVLGGGGAYFQGPEDRGDWDSLRRALFEFPDNYGNEGYDPTADDPYPRVTGPPILRRDLRGEPVRLVFTFGDSGAHYAHVIGIDEVGEDVELESLAEQKLGMVREGDESYEEPDRYCEVVWHDIEDAVERSNDGGSSGSSSGSSTDVSMDAVSQNGNFSYDDLGDEWTVFVDELAGDENVNVDDFDDWDSVVEGFAEDNSVVEHDPDVLADIVEARS